VPDLNDTSLTIFQGWTLRIRESTEASPRLLVLIHGLSGDENSMWVFAHDLPSRYWIVAPRGPHAALPTLGGYSWRPPQFENLDQFPLDLIRSTSEAVIHLVDEYSASVGLDASVFDLMGFSQGAAVSSALAFLYSKRIGKVGILAGFVPSGLESLVSQHPVEGKPFFVVHGTRDERVPIERARASTKILEQAGANVTYCEDNVGHKVSVTCLRALKRFFKDP
jgi:phospholipase/carboxylesterase